MDEGTVDQEEEEVPKTPREQEEHNPAKEQRRAKIVEEVLTTERSYVQGLTILVKKYYNPVESSSKAKKPIIPPEKVAHLFSISDVLLNYHSMFLEGLSKRILNWSSTQLLGDFFVEMVIGPLVMSNIRTGLWLENVH